MSVHVSRTADWCSGGRRVDADGVLGHGHNVVRVYRRMQAFLSSAGRFLPFPYLSVQVGASCDFNVKYLRKGREIYSYEPGIHLSYLRSHTKYFWHVAISLSSSFLHIYFGSVSMLHFVAL
jgi:hypothetical protein